MKSSTYRILSEILNAITHGVASLLSIVGLIFLLVKGAHISPLHIIAYTLYGSTLILLFLSSTLFHSLIFTKAKKILQIFDHSSIYLLIAGSYTPYCLLSIKGALGLILMIIIWLLAFLGVIYKSIALHKRAYVSKISTILYIGMGWLCLIAIQPLLYSLGVKGVLLMLAGGVSYTLGAIFYTLKKIKFMHVIWHLFVILGASFMFFSIFLTT
ncbi:MAG: hemolysin III family protein [Streptococcaceae bacterium]|jgi:hemolysin III|nr:hemolysin III family protein [Streptococcaceae bacterium]